MKKTNDMLICTYVLAITRGSAHPCPAMPMLWTKCIFNMHMVLCNAWSRCKMGTSLVNQEKMCTFLDHPLHSAPYMLYGF